MINQTMNDSSQEHITQKSYNVFDWLYVRWHSIPDKSKDWVEKFRKSYEEKGYLSDKQIGIIRSIVQITDIRELNYHDYRDEQFQKRYDEKNQISPEQMIERYKR